MTKEEQRVGRNKETQIRSATIDSNEYRRKFDLITDDDNFNRLLYQTAKKMLRHRSGTLLEDMAWFDLDNCSLICEKTDETEEEVISHSPNIDNCLSKCHNIVAMHTHPQSLPPSPDDFNCFIKCDYKLGIVLCHDGKIFCYVAYHEVDKTLWEKYVDVAYQENGNEVEAQLAALNNFQQNGDIRIWEVIV